MSDLYIFGDITEHINFYEDTSAGSFAYDLSSFDGDLTVHINSSGGSVFAALAIYNALKSYSRGTVTVSIDGLAASAASIVAMAGKKICMASNALFMIHSPAAILDGYYDSSDIGKLQTQLAQIEQSMIKTYSTRISEADARRYMRSETWFSAEEALEAGLIDEITEAVDMRIDNSKSMIFVNKLAISTKKFNAEKLRRAAEAKTMDEQKIVAQVRQQELSRIRDLQALRCDNAAVNAIVDVALSDGRSVADVQNYINAIKKIPVADSVADRIVAVIRDQLKSGAENVVSQPAETEADRVKAQADLIVKFANGTV